MPETAENIDAGSVKVDLPVSGAAVYWILSTENDYESCRESLISLGYEDFVPDERTDSAALKAAMSRIFGGTGVLIRSLANDDGFVAKREVKGDSDNDYQTIVTVKLDATEKNGIEFIGDVHKSTQMKFVGEMLYQKSLLTQSQIAKLLVDIITDGDGLQGDPLKPSGGIYWIGAKHLDEWDKLASSMEKISCGAKPNSLFTLRVVYDDNSVKALQEAIRREIRERSEEIKRTAAAEGLGECAYKNRMKDAERLHDRIKAYEAMYAGMFDDTLTELHALAGETQDNVLDLAAASMPDLFGAKD